MFKKENNKKIIVYILIGIVVVIGAIKLIDIYYQNNNEEITIQNVLTTEDEPEKIENETIKVYVTGEVKNQGVIELEQGSRIVDAIEKAGGQTEEANLKNVNLAYELEDGQKIYIPNKSEENTNEITDDGVTGIDSKENDTININKADEKELQELNGIGESLASSIIKYREDNGKFKNIEDLKNVPGIGESKFSNIKEKIKVKWIKNNKQIK